MSDFNASDIIGKTLIAAQNVSIKRLPFDASPIVFNVNPGQTVGTVYSYLIPGSDRKNLFWQFIDSNGRYYYAEHLPGIFNVRSLADQGVLTSLEKTQAEQKANESIKDFIERNIKFIAIAAGLIVIAKTFISNKK